jgi:hypothetical protein
MVVRVARRMVGRCMFVRSGFGLRWRIREVDCEPFCLVGWRWLLQVMMREKPCYLMFQKLEVVKSHGRVRLAQLHSFPATHQERVVKFHNGMSILPAILGVSVQLCSSASYDCSMVEGSLEHDVRCRTVRRLTTLYKPLIVRGLVRRRKTKRCLVQERTWIHARHQFFVE